ncbi:bifunctional aspartate kinase/homoserine dehydrogenase I [Dokdonia sinensis]|uniref:Bifunctional aspartate kinase/homoserine dehydrogenase I n=1 Tax=Dokdonia sinensis TaxID=2479847 RepID=A0A3M0GI88_9FLAO|nr:bifunctional aspartate kinase/homoserine dehydrogenase I [Dokdonia sinensis]RMB56986.1 bifunctional aspartate kinase/homoserine dehydrogenase I [Dokdonia sinensis]
MRVLKFGGTSVGSVENIEKVIAIVANQSKLQPVAVVVSAVGGITDLLLKAGTLAAQKDEAYKDVFQEIHQKHTAFAKALTATDTLVTADIGQLMSHLDDLLNGIFLINELSPKTLDKLAAFGELTSSRIITAAFNHKGIEAKLKDSRTLIKTDAQHTKASVLYAETNQNITSYFAESKSKITILGGFIASTRDGETSTLGRGGSDFTAAILAAALNVDQLEIWTDVSGMFSANPKLVKQAKPINDISYHEAMELSHFGAKVLYPPTIVPALSKNIPIYIKNTMAPEEAGTRIGQQEQANGNPIKGISHISDIALLTLEGAGMVGTSGISKRLFEVLSQQQVNIILITQASSEHSICIGVMEADALRAKTAIETEFAYELSLHRIDPVIVETELAVIALVGESMKSHQGISGKMFSTLGKNNVNIRAIAQGASEKNISAVIAEKDVKKALNSLHEVFFEGNRKQINLFIMGVGNVGGRLLAQIKQQRKFLRDNLNLNLRVMGLSNSRTMLVSKEPIDLDNWESQLAGGEDADILRFRESVIALNQRNSVFVDITANEPVAMAYEEYMRNSISVVACNKIAAAGSYAYYSNLKRLSRKYNAPFMFETNVGAGLPIIDTLQNLIASGDRIVKIQAVLSGSLNFVFNNFRSGDSFYDVVQQAKDEGYTEPDPRIDLSGVDVARKILILARESGQAIELDDIVNTPFLTKNNLESTDVPHFFETLKEDASHFEKLVSDASSKGERLKYVAQLDNGKSSVGLQSVGPDSPFYNLEGSDNIVLFYTERYPEQPLIVKGAGAGGDVTASGLFSDIIRLRQD